MPLTLIALKSSWTTAVHGSGTPSARRRLHDETQVLEVQVDLEAGVVGARDVVRALLLEALRARESAAERLERERAVEARLLGERQGLAERGQVDGDDDLVGELGEAARAQRPQVRDGLAERLEDGQRGVEVGLLAAHHDAQRGVDGSLFASRHGRVEHPDALGAEGLADLLRDEGRDRRHVEVEEALPGSLPVSGPLNDAVAAEGHQLDLGRVRQHRDQHVDLGRHVLGGGRRPWRRRRQISCTGPWLRLWTTSG